MKNKLSVGLLWHSDSSGNLGVGALTLGHMELIRRASERAQVETALELFRAYDPPPSYVTSGIIKRHDINGRFMVKPSGYWREAGKMDVMLDIGGGDSFTDIYSNKRFAYICATKAICFMRGVPLVFAPQTLGPFSCQPHTVLAALAMRKAEAVFARDPLSFDAIGRLAPTANRRQAIDVAFAMPFTQAPKSESVRIGVNVSGLLYSGGYGGRNDYGLTIDYASFTHGLIERLLKAGAQVELISHVNSTIPRDDDGRIAEQVHQLYPQTIIAPRFTSPIEAKSYISGLDMLVAARMHASIAAWSAGVPVLPVSYSRKFEGLYQALDYPWLIPAKGFSTEQAIEKAMEAFHNRDQMKQDLKRGLPAVEKGLEAYVSYLADLFRRLAEKN